MTDIQTPLTLTDDQRDLLQRTVSRPTTERRILERAQVVLAIAQGATVSDAARATGLTRLTARKWRDRFLAQGLDGLSDAPRSGQPRKLKPEVVAEIVRTTQTEAPPPGRSHWSRIDMARRFGTNATMVGTIWRAHGLKPHRASTFKLSTDPDLVEKVRDIVGLYLAPPDNAIVLCVDEKSGIQALDRTQPLLPVRPGQLERRTWDYTRHGTTNLHAALDVATGHVISRTEPRQRAAEFLAFLRQIDRQTPKGMDLHLVLDNSATHKTAEVREWLAAHPRFRTHFTPTSGSWLNLVETWFSGLTRRRLKRGVFKSVNQLEEALKEYVLENNKSPQPFKWTKPADLILNRKHMARN